MEEEKGENISENVRVKMLVFILCFFFATLYTNVRNKIINESLKFVAINLSNNGYIPRK